MSEYSSPGSGEQAAYQLLLDICNRGCAIDYLINGGDREKATVEVLIEIFGPHWRFDEALTKLGVQLKELKEKVAKETSKVMKKNGVTSGGPLDDYGKEIKEAARILAQTVMHTR